MGASLLALAKSIYYPCADGYYIFVSCGLILSLVQIYFSFFCLVFSLMAMSI